MLCWRHQLVSQLVSQSVSIKLCSINFFQTFGVVLKRVLGFAVPNNAAKLSQREIEAGFRVIFLA